MSTERKVIEMPDRIQRMQRTPDPFDVAMGLKVWEEGEAIAITSKWSRSELAATSVIADWSWKRMIRRVA